MDFILLIQDEAKCWALVNAVKNLRDSVTDGG
jgi:hypothetical protein